MNNAISRRDDPCAPCYSRVLVTAIHARPNLGWYTSRDHGHSRQPKRYRRS